MNFEKIIGNNDIIENLIFMVENDKINHALLFDGISGIGKKYAAKILAKSIFCNGKILLVMNVVNVFNLKRVQTQILF